MASAGPRSFRDAGGIAHHRQSVRDILDYHGTRTDGYSRTNLRALPDHRARTDPRSSPNANVTGKVRSWRDMNAFLKMTVVVDARGSIHDYSSLQNRRRLNHGSSHHDAARGTDGIGAYRCITMHEHGYGMTLPGKAIKQAQPRIHITDRNKAFESHRCLPYSVQRRNRVNWRSQSDPLPLIVMPFDDATRRHRLNHVEDDSSVPTSPYEVQRFQERLPVNRLMVASPSSVIPARVTTLTSVKRRILRSSSKER